MKTYQLLILCAALFATALFTGCHAPSSAVVRTVILTNSPTEECITNAVRKVSGIDQVMPVTVKAEPTWSVYHRYNRELPYENYLYIGPGTRGMISVKPQSTKVVGLELSRTWTNGKPTDAEIDDARRIMDEIYKSLMQECGKLPPPESVTENYVNLKEYQQTHGGSNRPAEPSR